MIMSLRTCSGTLIDLASPQPEDFLIKDIARGLSHCCRFSGQLPQFYSVAQHSVLVAALVDQPLRLAALLHDASEAYLGDLARNVKHSLFLMGYCVLEQHVQGAIQQRFGYITSREDLEAIKRADHLAACFERVTLQEAHTADAFEAVDIERLIYEGYVDQDPRDMLALMPRLPRIFQPLSAPSAEKRFLSTFRRYHASTTTVLPC